MKNDRLLVSLSRDRFCYALSDTTRHILNFSDYDLWDTERFVLLLALDFGLAPRYFYREKIFAEFKSLGAQLLHHSATFVEQSTD